MKTLQGHSRGIACLQAMGNILASGSSGKKIIILDNSIRIWDLLSGECLKILEGHNDLVRTLQFNQNYIVSGSYDQVDLF